LVACNPHVGCPSGISCLLERRKVCLLWITFPSSVPFSACWLLFLLIAVVPTPRRHGCFVTLHCLIPLLIFGVDLHLFDGCDDQNKIHPRPHSSLSLSNAPLLPPEPSFLRIPLTFGSDRCHGGGDILLPPEFSPQPPPSFVAPPSPFLPFPTCREKVHPFLYRRRHGPTQVERVIEPYLLFSPFSIPSRVPLFSTI